MASGASQMTDDRGCHGDGANEEVICGAGPGRMTMNLANSNEKERYRQPLFKYLLVFITQTNTSVSSLSSAPFYYTSRTLSFQKIFCD